MIAELQLDIPEAISILRQSCSRIGKRHNRIHYEAALDNIHRLRAIDGGICGQCPSLYLEAIRCYNKQSVAVGCRKRYSPLELYRRTELGKIPECPGFDI